MFIQVCTKQRSTRFNRILSVWLQVSARSVLRWEPDGTNGEPVPWVTFAFVLGLFDSRCGAAVWFVGFPQRGSRPVRSVSLEEQSCRKPKRDAGEGGGSAPELRDRSYPLGVNPAGPHVCGVKIIALFVQWLTEKMRQAASRNSILPRLILILHGYSSPVQVSAAFSWNQLPNLSTGDWPELQSPPFDSSCCAADTDTATQKSAASLLRLVRWHVHALSWNVEAWTRFCSARGGCAQCGLTSSPQKSFHSWCF